MFRFASRSDLVLPPLPTVGAAGEALPVQMLDLATELRRYSPAVHIEPAADASYAALSAAQLGTAHTWTLRALAVQLGRSSAYTVNAFDCEDFATELCQTLRKMLARAGEARAPLVGVLSVEQIIAWGGVPAGGRHAVCGAFTGSGLYVMEAQTGAVSPLSSYPNRATILRASGF